jgi:N-acetyl-anhydromuramyl-L-alanine amidase AmpD
MRNIEKIIVHHSASGSAVTTVEKIDRWHKDRGWSGIGYHYVIYPDGSVNKGRHINKTGAHCRGHNTGSIGICVAGNFEIEPVTDTQKAGLFDLIEELLEKYELSWFDVYGHRELGNSLCPGEALFKELVLERDKNTCQS